MSAIPIEEIYFPTRLILYNRRLDLIEGDTANYPNFDRTRCSSGSDAVKLIMKLDDNCYPDYNPIDYYDINGTERYFLLYPRDGVDLPPIPDDTSDPAIIDEVLEKCKIWCAFNRLSFYRIGEYDDYI